MMLNEKTKAKFKARICKWAKKLDVQVRLINVRAMTTKWASCSTAGRLTFDSGLLKLAGNLQDYVIVHELLHFHVPNHGRLWKSLMRAHLGNYEAKEKRLKVIAGNRMQTP
jgi:predicted metal-dependent hydrolase